MRRTKKRLSKFLTLILRHTPENFGVKLDREGFAAIEDIIEAVNKTSRFRNIDSTDIIGIVKNDEKGRFELTERGGKLFIRARYGHNKNLNIDITYPKVRLGEIRFLYHGTQAENIDNILQDGLLPGDRKYVHMSATINDAFQVAKRQKREPVVLVINAEAMLMDGQEIFRATNKVYLAKYVAPKYIQKVLRKHVLY